MTQSSCLCGTNIISWTATPALKFRCHCTDERKLTGAAFALNIIIPAVAPTVLKGELVVWGKVVDSGNTMYNHSCGQCGSLLYRHSTGYPGVFTVKAGCIDSEGGEEDASSVFVPDIEIFTRSRVPYVPAFEGVVQCEGDFTKEALAALGF
ncbi:hypothetical protein LCER1_G005532 [Lachnellula cervina]|uniref:CENP-V/GFA domain-containing protein n=1 Tax=Lachnellula cervina TaxID=1316786 RepID=A0A7D8UZY9_9HELO|nr:hypothetical protein LCER1_G005532 [Lachnellula cervina]